MIRIIEPQIARQTILKRNPPDAFDVPPRILESIQAVMGEALTPAQAVDRILSDVRQHGDDALRDWSTRLDGISPPTFRVPAQDMQSALNNLEPALREALQQSAVRVEAFHRRQPLTSWFTQELGGTLGQVVRPIQRVGLYAPGGTAPLPSTVIMTAVLARVAGVKEIVLVSPPQYDTGLPAAIIQAAAAICGVEEVYAIGGAQAIAALAYGTDSIPAVGKIFGPGNLFVTLAKQKVYGMVGIDSLAGPTETVIIADDSANPAWAARDLLAQAEHDVLASAILLTPSRQLAEAVQAEVALLEEVGASQNARTSILELSLTNRSGIVVTRDLEEAVRLSNEYGPEHLALAVTDPWRWAEKVTSAGGVFLGEHSFEVLGDYIAGPSHVMPTGGSARFSSPLNLWDFVRIISLVALDPHTAAEISGPAARIARAEGLQAHALAAEARTQAQSEK